MVTDGTTDPIGGGTDNGPDVGTIGGAPFLTTCEWDRCCVNEAESASDETSARVSFIRAMGPVMYTSSSDAEGNHIRNIQRFTAWTIGGSTRDSRDQLPFIFETPRCCQIAFDWQRFRVWNDLGTSSQYCQWTIWTILLKRLWIPLKLLARVLCKLRSQGESNRPGAYTISSAAGLGGTAEQMGTQMPTISRGLRMAGGITQSADVRQIKIRRPQRNAPEQIINGDLWELSQRGLHLALIGALSTTVWIPPTPIIIISSWPARRDVHPCSTVGVSQTGSGLLRSTSMWYEGPTGRASVFRTASTSAAMSVQ